MYPLFLLKQKESAVDQRSLRLTFDNQRTKLRSVLTNPEVSEHYATDCDHMVSENKSTDNTFKVGLEPTTFLLAKDALPSELPAKQVSDELPICTTLFCYQREQTTKSL